MPRRQVSRYAKNERKKACACIETLYSEAMTKHYSDPVKRSESEAGRRHKDGPVRDRRQDHDAEEEE